MDTQQQQQQQPHVSQAPASQAADATANSRDQLGAPIKSAPSSSQQHDANALPSQSVMTPPPQQQQFPPPPNSMQQPMVQQYQADKSGQGHHQPPFQNQGQLPMLYQPSSPPPHQQQQQQQQQQQHQQYGQPQLPNYGQSQQQPHSQYGYHVPQFNMPHIPGLGHFGGAFSNTSGGYHTAPSAPPTNPTTPGASSSASNDDPGVIHEVMGNGTTIRKHADGHKSTQHPDGTIVHTYHDGSTKTINRDGTESYYTPTTAKADYVDKAFAIGAKHFGLHVSENTREKITDKGRGMFEKFTGKKVPAKWSN